MTNKVYSANTESVSQIRLVRQSSDFLGGNNSEYPLNMNRYKQNQTNYALKQTELSLDNDFKQLFASAGLNLVAMRLHHNSPFLAKCLGTAKYTGLANGFTFIIFEFDNHPKLFEFSICATTDTFSRLEGRVYTKRKAYHGLRKYLTDKTISNFGLNIYPDHEKNVAKSQDSITPFKISNYIVRHFIKKPVLKLEPEINSLEFVNEDEILDSVKASLIKSHNLIPESIRLHTQYVRRYNNSLFNGLLGTNAFFNKLTDETKELHSTGGFTIYGIVGTNAETNLNEIFITYSRCSNEEGYNKSYGRKQCLQNFLNQKYNPYTLKQEIENIGDSLIQILQTYIKKAINIDLAPKPSDLIPK